VVGHAPHAVDEVGSTGFEVVDHGAHVCSVELLELLVGSTCFDDVVAHGAQLLSAVLVELVVGSTGLDDEVDHGAQVT